MPLETNMKTKSKISLAVFICCIAFFLVTLDATIVNSALYTMQHEFNVQMSAIQWIVDAYTISLAALMLSTGALSDRIGANHLLRLGFLIFFLASGGCSFANSISILIAMRILQGIGAALMLPASLALISKSVDTDKARAKMTSLWAAAGGVAVVLGPVLGGLLTSLVGWRSVFLINIPICAICVLYLFFRSTNEASIKRSFDILGQILGTAFLLLITAGIVEFRNNTYYAIIFLISGVIIGCFFLLYENYTSNPAFPLSLWKNAVFNSCAFTGFSLNFSYFGSIFVLALLFQQSYKFSPANTGILFIPLTIFIMASNLISGKISEKYGTYRPLLWGQLVEALGFLIIGFAIFSHMLTIMLFGMLFVGIGAGTASPPMMSTLMSSVNSSDAGLAAGALNCLRQFGTVLGVAIFGLIIEGSMEIGATTSLVLSGIILLISSLGTILLVPKNSGK